LLADIQLTRYIPNEDVFAVVDQCKTLDSITLSGPISDDVLSYLCFSKKLVNITLDMEKFPNVDMLKSYLKELPLLQSLYIWGWFEADSEYNLQELVSSEEWTEAEVDHLRRYLKPHHDGHDFMYLDMQAMRNNGWMNDTESAE